MRLAPRVLFVVLAACTARSTPAAAQQPAQPSLAPFRVVSVSPRPNALAVPRDASVRVTFNQPVDASSLDVRRFHVFGRWSGPSLGTLSLSADGRTLTFAPLRRFSAGETVHVTLAKDVQSAGGQPLGRGFAWSFWTRSRASSYRFTLIDTLIPGETPYGAYGGDLDHDGDLDLCIPNENTSDVSVFLNGGDGTFGSATSFPAGLHCSPSEGADLDFDGHVDLVVANILDDDVSVLLGNGDGTFQPQARYGVGSRPHGLALLDADGDGDMDAVTPNRVSGDLSLLENLGDGTFAPEVRFQGGVANETAVTACEMNGDGVLDLVVVGYGSGEAAVMLGAGDGTFQLHDVRSVGASPWMVVAGDVDGDGWNDVATILSGAGSAAITRNDGDGGLLAPVTYPAGSFAIAIDLGDLDGDGDLDLSTSSYNAGIFRIRANQGDGTFGAPMDLPSAEAGSCTVLHDFDGDGDLDITGIDELADEIYLFRQDG